MPETFSCPLCQSAGATGDNSISPAGFSCNRCGVYSLEFRFLAAVSGPGTLRTDPDFVKFLPYLSAHLRQASERGEIVELNHENWKTFAEGHAHTTVSRKLDMALRLYCHRSIAPGAVVELDPDDFVLLDAADVGEMRYLRRSLSEQQLLDHRGVASAGTYEVTPKGWARLEPVDPGGVPGTCFVAMAFDPSLDGVYENGIKPAVLASGLSVVNVGKVEHNGVVTDLIHAEIRRAQVVIADVTTQRPNVYFEAGLALGLGRTVIWCCREDEITRVHFDTRQYSHVVWKDAADLRMKLEARIRGTLTLAVKR